MSGKPAARQGDMTQYGGSIVQGSAGVRIGAPTGVVCSVCPGGVTSGHPVNPLLGAKVLPGETDIALPGPLPFILSRTYSSYRTKTPAPVGSLGPGWKMPADIRLQLRDNTLILSDNGGRSLYFEHLFPGEDGYSRSESLWLVRGGVAKLDEGHRLAALWQALPEELRLSPHRYLATNSPQGPWWLLGWCERVPEADEVLPAPLPPYRVLTGLVDRFGRTQTFHREAAGEFSGEITGVTDGAGRHFRLVLTTQAQRAEEARQQAISGGTEPSAFPDTLPGYTEYSRDNGIRLSAVWLTHDPEYPENLPAAPLVRYGWTPRGELAVVYDRSGKQVRSFTYDDKYRGRMVAHRHTGRPEIRYRYDSDGRVTEQLNPAGLSYTYQYEKDRITITDSLNRREVLHTQGEGGLKRVVKKEHADGSVTQSQFDAVGRLRAQTDAAGRTTEYSPDVVTGLITRITTPDGRASAFYYNHHSQLTSATGPDGLEIRREYDEWGNLLSDENPHHLQQLIRLPGQQYDEESGLYYNRHRYYDPLQGRYITQDPIGLKGGWNFYQYPLNPVQYIDSMGLASKYGHLNNGGYGAKPSKPPTPDPSKLPDIAKQLRLPYPIDQASSAPNVFKTFFRALSPYDYTLYCRKWVKPNLTCTPQDDPQYPGMETKTASDYLPQTNWSTTQLPPGYTCAEPYLFPDINKPDGPATAGIDDLGEILAKMKQRTLRGIRK
ncbi:RHS repeat protein [Escherichia coli]|uniref:RHS repeat protein n=3 Tax=Escherichia coli TaxID=562 RepID=A0A376FQ35_ECOLX|nr:RHS repeat-associated core domain-containing protein [Escherichia coli]MDS1488988.1 RHS repeat-associated core domain-containing protein [Escherichia coli]QPR04118.1 RHS repeat protein [Escherichia coli]STD35486.1 YD repeat-containing protein [Escherichia coli]